MSIMNARLAHVASQYEKKCDRSYIGPQGPDLSVFLEEACEMEELTKCNLEMFSTQKTKPKKYKGLFTISRHYDRAEATVKDENKHMHSLTDILSLTSEGKEFLASCKFFDPVVYTLKLRCGGGSYRGRPSGSNCVRVACRSGWCTGAGECSEGCGWSKTRNFKDRLLHMCDFTVTITATLSDIVAGRRQINITGNHGYPNRAEWVPPNRTALRAPAHLRERALKVATTIKGPSASTTLYFINSPSGSKSRSYLSTNTYYKGHENYRRGTYSCIFRIGMAFIFTIYNILFVYSTTN
jgi:hypothetical protein